MNKQWSNVSTYRKKQTYSFHKSFRCKLISSLNKFYIRTFVHPFQPFHSIYKLIHVSLHFSPIKHAQTTISLESSSIGIVWLYILSWKILSKRKIQEIQRNHPACPVRKRLKCKFDRIPFVSGPKRAVSWKFNRKQKFPVQIHTPLHISLSE